MKDSRTEAMKDDLLSWHHTAHPDWQCATASLSIPVTAPYKAAQFPHDLPEGFPPLHLTSPPLSSNHAHILSFHLALLYSFTFLHLSVYQHYTSFSSPLFLYLFPQLVFWQQDGGVIVLIGVKSLPAWLDMTSHAHTLTDTHTRKRQCWISCRSVAVTMYNICHMVN